MSAEIVVAVVVAVVVLAGLAVGVMTAARRRRLQQRFGPEYDRLVGERDSKRKAEAELTKRERRVRDLGIRPLTDSTRAGYTRQWASLQERFADMPADAVAASQILVADVMNERGYPTDDRDQVLADLSVEHAKTLGHYRAAEEISESAGAGTASTEHLRQAMIHYRKVFRELLGAPADPSGPGFPGRSSPGSLGPDHPSRPGADHPSRPRVIGRSAEPRPESSRAQHHDPYPQTASPAAVPGSMTGGFHGGPPTRPPAAPPGRTQGLARAVSPAARARYEGGLDGGQSQAVLTQAPRTGRERATGLGGQLAVDQAGELADHIWQQVEDLWNTDSIRPAVRVLAEAHDQAAEVITTAERKAAEITQSAAERAAATITRAEREAAELREAAAKMTAELGGVTADVVENPAIPAKPATEPEALPVAEPAARPVTEPQTRPATRPASRPQREATENVTRPAMPATRPGTRPGISPRRTPKGRPGGKPKSRQVRAWRKMAAAVVALSLVGLTSAATEIRLHGFSFFIFRSAGTGATSGNGVPENQGPGQPGVHHKAQSKQAER